MDSASLCIACIGQVLLVLVFANGAPVLARDALGDRLALPVDLGRRLADGMPVFGAAKTWRGLVLAVCAGAVAAWLVGMAAVTGAVAGLWAMLGDLLASFAKRRLGLAESRRCRGLDVLPESLLPTLYLAGAVEFSWPEVIVAVAVFFLIDAGLSPLLYRLHLRRRPY